MRTGEGRQLASRTSPSLRHRLRGCQVCLLWTDLRIDSRECSKDQRSSTATGMKLMLPFENLVRRSDHTVPLAY